MNPAKRIAKDKSPIQVGRAPMLHRSRFSYGLHKASQRVSACLTGFCAVEACLTKLPDKPAFGPYYGFLQWQADKHGWWLITVAAGLVGVCSLAQRFVGSPGVWETLHALLCGTQALVFPEEQFNVPNYHRVTLFRAQTYKSKSDAWGLLVGFFTKRNIWLVPIVRSGHTDQKTKSMFAIGDSEEECQGIAGRAWFLDRIVSVGDLPDLGVNSPTPEQISEYAKRTLVPEGMIRMKRPRARSILSVPVKRNGALWGVLVFDSRGTAQINRDNVDRLCNMLTSHLGTMIERVL